MFLPEFRRLTRQPAKKGGLQIGRGELKKIDFKLIAAVVPGKVKNCGVKVLVEVMHAVSNPLKSVGYVVLFRFAIMRMVVIFIVLVRPIGWNGDLRNALSPLKEGR